MRQFLRRAFLENTAIKAVSLALAVTLFVLVRGDKETERMVRVPLAYIRPTDRVLVSEVPEGLDVWLRGPWTRLKRLDPADVQAIVIDLTKTPDGEVTITEDMLRLPAGMRVGSIRPAKINVAFEHLKKVPVVPEPVGAPVDGFVVERIQPEPSAINVKGPKAAIDAIADVRTLPISLAGKRTSFTAEAALSPLPKGVTAEVDKVSIDVQIEEEIAARVLANVPVALNAPAGNARPVGFELDPEKVEVTLRGGRNAVKLVDPRKVAAHVELRLEDYTPGQTRSATIVVDGIPPGVAVEVAPRETTVTMKIPPPPPGGPH